MANETELAIDLAPIRGFDLDLSQYFGLWAVESHRFLATFERVANMDLFGHVAANMAEPEAAARRKSAVMGEDIALIEIDGTMTKRGSSLSGGGSTIEARQMVRKAATDPSIAGILLKIDSPGGTVSGTADLAEDVFRANKRKPVMTFAEDLTASAAYWVASQSDGIIANAETAMIGSIGTFVGLYDMSGAAGQQGIRPIVIKSGEFKGAGFPGAQVTPEQIAEWQMLVDKTQAQFTAAVARGRSLSRSAVSLIADGRVHLAADAQELGLIDGIGSFGDAISELRSRASSRRAERKVIAMSEETKAPAPASFKELRSACPTAEADFIVAQLAADATVDSARAAWAEACEKRANEAEAKAAIASATVESMKAAPGVDELSEPIESTLESTGDPVAEWEQKVRDLTSSGKTRPRAVSAAAKQYPELHRAYVVAVNEKHKRPLGRFA